jgi:hypothetical protein
MSDFYGRSFFISFMNGFQRLQPLDNVISPDIALHIFICLRAIISLSLILSIPECFIGDTYESGRDAR